MVQSNKISSAKCDRTWYNNKQNCIKKRISTLRETEDRCIIIDDSSDSSDEVKNIKNDFPIEPEDKLKKQDDNTKKDCHSKTNLMPQSVVNSYNSTGDLLEKNKSNQIQNYYSKEIPMTQIAANRSDDFIDFPKFNKISNRIEKKILATDSYNMKLKHAIIGNSVIKEVMIMSTTVNSVSNLNTKSTLIKKIYQRVTHICL